MLDQHATVVFVLMLRVIKKVKCLIRGHTVLFGKHFIHYGVIQTVNGFLIKNCHTLQGNNHSLYFQLCYFPVWSLDSFVQRFSPLHYSPSNTTMHCYNTAANFYFSFLLKKSRNFEEIKKLYLTYQFLFTYVQQQNAPC